MKTAIALVVALGMGAGLTTVSARAQDGKKYDKGSTVTLQGCVNAAEKKGTFILTNVHEWPIANSDMGKYGKRYYWIDKGSKDFKDHLGHTIQVTGKITDVDKSEIEFKSGESGMGTNVEIETPGKDIKTTAAKADVPAGAKMDKHDMPITLLKVHVDDVKMTSSTCSPM
jgi:hypothetical protein